MQRYIVSVIIICVSLAGTCNAQTAIDTLLLEELEEMAKVDQLAAAHAHPPEEYIHLSQEEWEVKKDSIFRANQNRIAEIFSEFGYPGFDQLGKRGSSLFWLIVQHADFDPNFQKEVLDSMYVEVQKQNADSRKYAFLTDRVQKNQGKKLIYGTQLDYNLFTGRARPLPTIDPLNLNKRRQEVGLEPIEEYLDDMTKSHLQGNPTILGITIPGLTIIIGLLLVFLTGTVIIRKKMTS